MWSSSRLTTSPAILARRRTTTALVILFGFMAQQACADLLGGLQGMLNVNFICERGDPGTFVESDCGMPLDIEISADLTADHIISDALHSCVREITGLSLDFLRPSYQSDDASGRRLGGRMKQNTKGGSTSSSSGGSTSSSGGTYKECQKCPCDNKACCDLGYCSGSSCCRNCSCKRRSLLPIDLTAVVPAGGDSFQQVLQQVEETIPEVELSVEFSCTDHIRVVVLELQAMGNNCLGKDPEAVTCYAKIF